LKYLANAITQLIVILVKFLLSGAVFILHIYTGNPILIVAQLILLALILMRCHYQKLDFGKYYKDLQYHALINHATYNFDTGLMLQISMEHIAERKRYVFLDSPRLNKSNALIYKTAISTIRTSKTFYLMFFVAIIIVWALRFFEVLPHTTIGVSIGQILTSTLIGMFTNSLRILFCDNLSSLLNKRQAGLFLPYTDNDILKSFAFISCSTVAISFVFFSVLHSAAFWVALVAICVVTTVLLLSLYLTIRVRKVNLLVRSLLVMVCFACSVLISGS
jgi:hypothetical protein